ncbi:hypothetical protein Ddc_13235 [Ditylenchus destructor]|nr:hypothetical protein Ddc_13235 [Ditylenchus destructor]
MPRNIIASGKTTDSPRKLRERKSLPLQPSNLRERKPLHLQPSYQETDDSSDDSSNEDEIYEVDQILAMKTLRGKRKFLANKAISEKSNESPTRSSTSRTQKNSFNQLNDDIQKEYEEMGRLENESLRLENENERLRHESESLRHQLAERDQKIQKLEQQVSDAKNGSRQLVAEYVKVNKSNSGKTDERPTRSSTSRTHARKILLKRSCNTKKGKVDYAEKNEDEKVEPAMKRPRRGTRESKGSVASAEHIKDSDAQVEPDNEIFEVDRILSMKTVRGKRKFLENSQLSVAATQDLANNLQQDHPDSNHVDSPVDTNGSDTKKEDSHDETSDTGDSLKIESSDNKTTLDSPSAEESGIASDEDAINRQPQKCEKCEVSKSKIPARHNVNFTRMFFDYRDKTIRYVGIDQNTKKLHNYTLTEAYSADAWSLVCFFHSKVSSTSSGEGEINI